MSDYADYPIGEPTELTAGDLVEWRREDLAADYPASTWTLTYALISAQKKISITASANGDNFAVSVTAATTAAWPPGAYDWQAYVTSGLERHRVGAGRVQIHPNFAALAQHDARSHAQRVVDAIEAVIEGRATRDQEEYSIAGRQLRRTPIKDLIMLRDDYRAALVSETVAERLANNLGGAKRLSVRL